jgi:hypothetical protein
MNSSNEKQQRDVVLVVGSTGSLGKPLVSKLRQRDVSIRLLGRSKDCLVRAGLEESHNLDLVFCHDVTNRSSFLDEWFQDVHTVVCLARPRGLTSNDHATFEGLIANLSKCVCENQVPSMKMLGVPYLDQWLFEKIPSVKAIERAELTAKKIFDSSGHSSSLTIFRLAEMSEIGHMMEIANMTRLWISIHGYNPRVRPISADDFGEYGAEWVTSVDNTRSEFCIDGPQDITHTELGRSISQALGKRLFFLAIPLWIFQVLIQILHAKILILPGLEGIENVLILLGLGMTGNATSENHEITGKDRLDDFLFQHALAQDLSYVHDRIRTPHR